MGVSLRRKNAFHGKTNPLFPVGEGMDEIYSSELKTRYDCIAKSEDFTWKALS